ncbi:MAG TPA: sigma-70 family RNA polymerase sigma factor [Anaeromyxobacteraceae bacterium]|nr:sigma-70 family RNA polymerase sigma factor [Anaeromyxobacteraceae bacterium]
MSTSAGSAQSDDELVIGAAGGDAGAFSQLVLRHQDKVYGLALHLLRDPGEAEEVVQETFLAALEKLASFRGDAAFTTWLHRVAANAALMRLRRRRRAPEAVAPEPVEDLLPHFDADGRIEAPPRHDWSKRADEQLADREIRLAVEREIQNLPDDYRIVFLLRDVEGLSSEDMAEVLGISVAAVKSRLHRARLVLRARLGQFLEA